MFLQKTSPKKLRINYKIINSRMFMGMQQKQINLIGLEPYDFNTIRYSLQEALIKYFPMRNKKDDMGFKCYRFTIKNILYTLKAIQKIRNQIKHIQF